MIGLQRVMSRRCKQRRYQCSCLLPIVCRDINLFNNALATKIQKTSKMSRHVFCILLLNLMYLNLAFSSNVLGDASVNTLPEQLFGADSFTNGTKNFDYYSSSGNEEKVNISDYPYMAGINVKLYLPGGKIYEKNCTGAFIDYNNRVVTAAHCVVIGRKIVPAFSIIIRFNSNYLDRGGYTMYAESVQVHPWYSKNGKGATTLNDVAYIKARTSKYYISSQVMGAGSISATYHPSYFEHTSLSKLIEDAKYVSVLGFGFTKKSKKDKSLTKVRTRLQTETRCRSMVEYLNIMFGHNHACLYTEGLDMCQGEGGAVMINGWNNRGPLAIFGYGRNCGKKDHPAVFSPIEEFGNLRFTDQEIYGFRREKPLPEKVFWFDQDWEEMYEMSGEEGDGQIDSGNGTDVSISGCLTISPQLGLFMLFVEITSLRKVIS